MIARHELQQEVYMVRAALCLLQKILVVFFFSLLLTGAHNDEVVSPPSPSTALSYTVPFQGIFEVKQAA
jgi:secreted protein with Ig-like and vWFA domain